MCEYCDCRRIPEIAELGEEHEYITELADEVEIRASGGAPARMAALVRLREALTFHAQREERGIFAEGMVAGLKNYYIEDLEDDHRRFVEALSDPALDGVELQALLDDLHRHIAIEEYDVFPAAAKRLSDEQWQSIALANTLA
ncbi:MAG: hemerythrin domain-containing protein [Acidimicrobiia bacterium]|nr:hemerythrin domain-containing protein [Acidimicrobiia bacterium]